MRTVGIMSMQRIFNYGSSLQGYGLKRLIESQASDLDVSFVDFTPGELLVRDPAAEQPRAPWQRALSKVREYGEVEAPLGQKLRFFNHKRHYGSRYFPMVGIPAQPDHDRARDVLVIGSDEVFNCVQSNTRVGYSRDLFAHASPAARTVSYAGSFGNTNLKKIEDSGIRAELAADFAAFDAISVRDRNSADIVEALIGIRPEIHVDPALAFDFMQLEERIPRQRLHDGKYLIVYGYSGRLSSAENDILKAYARSIGARILTFGGVQECGDEFIDCDPFELLAYFRDAEAVVTDTFHGTIFSIINERPFGTIIRPSVGAAYGNEEKLGYLLDFLGLSSRRVPDMSHIGEILDTPIDFGPIRGRLAAERARTREYLARAVL